MTVTSVTKSWRGSGGSKEVGKRSYVVHYRVETDDATDGVKTVLNHFRDTASLPHLGDVYTYEGSGVVSDLGVKLWKIDPVRDLQSATSWNVAVSYKSPDKPQEDEPAGGGGGGVGEDEDGEPTENPLDFHGDLDISFVDVTRPVDRAIYRSGFRNYAIETGLVDPRYIQPAEQLYGGRDTEGPVVNSAMIPFNPPLERNATRISLRYSKNLEEYPQQQAAQFHRAVNEEAVTFDFKYQKLKFAIEPYKAQCVAINGTFNEANGIKFWRVTWDILVDDEFGFREKVVDRGLHARAMVGDPDGRGGTITSVSADQVTWRRITDKNGNPVSEPVLLNGNGQPLQLKGGGSFEAIEPVYITYSIYPEKPFVQIGLPIAGPE